MTDDAPHRDDEWCTVAEAARRLGVTPTAVRNRIKRRTLETKPNGNYGHLVRVPVPEPVPLTVPEPVTLTPDPVVVELRGQVTELQTRLAAAQESLVAMAGKLGAAQAEATSLQHERDRAEKLTGEVADLAKQLARVVEEAGAREREMHGQLTEIQARSWWRRLVG